MTQPEWFRTSVSCGLSTRRAFPAEVAGERGPDRALRLRFSRETVEQLGTSLRRHGLRFLWEADALTVARSDGSAVERVDADADGMYAVGHGYLDWTETTDRNTKGFLKALEAAVRDGYRAAADDAWTVAVVDRGDTMATLAIYPALAASEKKHREELYFQLYSAGLASFEVTAPDEAAAELRVRRWFAAKRAGVKPDAACKPLACPGTRIP
ncbi:hypothetical protein ABT095_14975 [Kitasatospora sp. NPDC002227]|uniref:hypothetical protein n=1 Tax=Kitasatospora sp. NPDC002227 TaxID=3154773 RepID=UPI0033266947